jgi:hypothetical protein
MGDNIVMGLHMDIAITCAKKALDFLEKNQYGEAKHELTKSLYDLEEAKLLYKKLGGK